MGTLSCNVEVRQLSDSRWVLITELVASSWKAFEEAAMKGRARSRYRIAIIVVTLICLFLDLFLALWRIWEVYFVSVPVFQFVAIAWGVLTGAITVAATSLRIGGAVWRALRGVTVEPPPFSIDETIRTIIRFCGRLLGSLPSSLSILTLLLVAAYFLLESHPRGLPPISSSVVVISKGPEKLIYVAAGDQGEIILWRATELSKPYARIPVGTSGNVGERGRPEQMLAVKRGESHWVFVTDTKSNKVHVVEGDTIIGSFLVGLTPGSLAITPDGRKLFVSNEQPVPSGTIRSFDIGGPDPNKFVVADIIPNITCPEGVAVSPRGDLLYVATQCGGGKDPVFLINTATNKIEGSIPNLATGSSVAVSADGTRLYVSRGNYPCTMPDGKGGSPLSIVDPQSRKIVNTVCLHTSVGPLAISRDTNGRYLFVGNGDRMTVFDRKSLDASDKSLNEIPLGSAVSGIGVAEDNSVFVYVPGTGLLFLYNPEGL